MRDQQSDRAETYTESSAQAGGWFKTGIVPAVCK